MNVILLIELLLICFTQSHTLHSKVFKCHHSKIRKQKNFKPQMLITPEIIKSNYLKSTDNLFGQHRPIRIIIEPIMLEKVSSDMKMYFLNTIMGSVVSQLKNLLQVTGPTKIPPFSKTGCFNDSLIPDSYKTSSTDADLIIFAVMDEIEDEIFAYATSCLLNDIDKRPVVGLVVMNSNHLNFSPQNIELAKQTLIHEMMHVLAFDPGLFDLFPIGKESTYIVEERKMSIGTLNATKIILPTVVKAARKFYKCDSITGVYLEDEGGDGSKGSHWEKIYFGNELMTAESTGDGVLSVFTLALLNDCGWYKVNMDQAQYFVFGRTAGCDFFQNSCSIKFPEYCSIKNRLECNRDRTSKSFCYQSVFSDGCVISLPIPELDCSSTNFFYISEEIEDEPGADSRCFNLKILNQYDYSACFQVNCQDDGIYSVRMNGENTVCKKKGQSFFKNHIEYICADYHEVCQKPVCRNMCSGSGKCLENGECLCNYFRKGKTCQKKRFCHKGDEQICPLIAPYAGYREDPDDDSEDESIDESTQERIINYRNGNTLMFIELVCLLTICGLALTILKND